MPGFERPYLQQNNVKTKLNCPKKLDLMTERNELHTHANSHHPLVPFFFYLKDQVQHKCEQKLTGKKVLQTHLIKFNMIVRETF